MNSRLDELKAGSADSSPASKKGPELSVEMVKVDVDDDVDATLAAFQSIMGGIQKIERNVDAINALKQRSRHEVTDDAQRKIMEELDRTMVASKRDARFVKSELDRVTTENGKYIASNEGSTSAQIRKNLLSTHIRHFQEVVQAYQVAGDSFRESLKERIARQARIVKEDITENQIEELMQSPNPVAIFQTTTVELDERMIDAVHDIEDRHKGMMRLEQGVKEVQELFQDMACLVDLQQETLDVIERNVQDTSKYTRQAEQNMIRAEQHAKGSRRKMCWILLIITCIAMIVVLFIVLA